MGQFSDAHKINLLRRERRGAFAKFTSCQNKKSTDFLGLVCIPKRDRLPLWHLRWKGKTYKDVYVASEWKTKVNGALKSFW